MASVNNNNDNNDASDERDAKRLRSSEPDLKVILGSGDEETVQWSTIHKRWHQKASILIPCWLCR